MNRYIYEIINTKTNDRYIGVRTCRCDIDKDKYKGENTIISKDFRKYGKKNFVKKILSITFDNKMEEIFILEYMNRFNYIRIEELSEHELISERTTVGAKNGASRKVVCLNTEEVFDTITDASNKYNVTKSGIIQACNPNYKVSFAGKNSKNEPLRWMYYDEYKAKSNGDIYEHAPSRMIRHNLNIKPVFCVETGETFNSIKEASETYNIPGPNISTSCMIESNHGGKHPDTGAPLHWKFVNKYDNNYEPKED